ncbi:cytochrome P450 2B4-like [Mercenaria mercenaria]|uniref:cytochrome P450 2B4-like n=1 Tax=Mercenaria mercenaria TaxID=6596 RepID=UPI00234F56F2|nr:cytochrome P450 2B4-like [Mercenaria mercenaria]
MDVTVILVLIIVFCVTFFFMKQRKHLPPGHFRFPIFGSVFLLRKLAKQRKHLVFAEEAKRYGGIFRWYLGKQMFVVLSGTDVINEALVKKAEVFSDRPPRAGSAFASKGIAWSNYGNYWRELRRFTYRTLRDFGVGKTSTEEKINAEIAVVSEFLKTSKGQPVSVSALMQKLVANVIYGIIFGRRYDYSDPEFDRVTKLSNVLNSASPISATFFLPKFLAKYVNTRDAETEERRKKALDDMACYVSAQIEEHKATFDSNNIRDFLDIYLDTDRDSEDGKQSIINKESMFWVIVDIFVAGTETTKTTLDWAFLYLSEFPDVQKKCQEEIEKVIGGKPIEYRDRNSLVYVNATIMEVHRHCCMAPLNLPHCTSQDTTLGGYHIPEGTIIFPMQYSVSRDPKLFKDPEKFDPTRFIDSKGQLINNLPIVPFSTGPRVCLGEALARTEIFLVITNLLQMFNFSPENPDKPQDFACDVTQSLNVAVPFKLRVSKRW